MMKSIKNDFLALWFVTLTLFSSQVFAFDHTYKKYDQILKAHVIPSKNGSVTQVEYKKINRAELQKVLAEFSAVTKKQFEQMSRDQQLAFLINSYNAFTLELILKNYPLKSIRDIGGFFSPPWKQKFFTFLDEKQHLDHIEHTLIRGSGKYNEPLIHFAVNCASIGCPALANEAFVAERLNQQLELSAQRFMSDRTRNYFNSSKKTLMVSKIFDWYGKDFELGHRGYQQLEDFMAQHADRLADSEADRQLIRQKKVKIDFLDYDWKLNERSL